MKYCFTLVLAIFSFKTIAQNYYLDLKSDINYTDWGSTPSVTSIKNMFDNARANENIQLKTVIGFVNVPAITMPSQSSWDAMTDQEQLFYLINQERKDRGLKEMELLYAPVSKVSQYYSDFLLQSDSFGHEKDQKTPWERLESVPGYTLNSDNCNYAENIAVFMQSNKYAWFAIPAAVYNWNYDDANSGWGHRRANLYKNFIDNYGITGKEGFMGVGVSKGQYTSHISGTVFDFTTMIVMDFFDPKSSFKLTSNIIFDKKNYPTLAINSNNNWIKCTNLTDYAASFSCYGLLGNEISKQTIAPQQMIEFYSESSIIYYTIQSENKSPYSGKIINF